MSSTSIVFQFQVKKIAFKALTTQANSLQFNLLYNNKKLSNTEPLDVPERTKELDLSHLDSLSFDTKDEINKYPITIFILYGQKSPAKKIILKRSQMMKKYETDKKDYFTFQQDFGNFSIFYEIKIKTNLAQSEEFIRESELLQNKGSKSSNKVQDSPARTLKRPSMLQIGAKAERIRKSSYENKQSSQSPVKNEADINDSTIKSQTKKIQSVTKTIPNLTFSKEQQDDINLVKKDVKINLFETFNPKQEKQKSKNEVKLKNSHRTEHSTQKDHQSQSHHSQHGHVSAKTSHRDLHPINAHSEGDHHSDHDSHDHHDDHHGHEGSHSLSLKLKTVIFMLIVGFLFLMYDALDDRFSRKARKTIVVDHGHNHGHGHNDLHHGEVKKKKNTKKQKKVVTH